VKEGEMTRARLVKRSEAREREQPRQQQPVSPLSQSVQSVREWVNERRTRGAADAREAFALLFAEPQQV
jgi:hypothetical protein